MKKLFAFLMVFVLLASAVAMADTYTSNTLNLKSLIRATTVVPVEEEAAPETETVAEEETVVEEEPVEEAAPDYQVSIALRHAGEKVHIGDTVTLVAVLSGFDGVEYQLQWQSSDDGVNWTDISGATAAEYTVEITRENSKKIWGVVVTTAD